MMKKILGKIAGKIGILFSLFYQISLQFFLLALSLFVILLALFYTNPGAKLTIGALNIFLKHPIEAQEIEGTLAGPLTLKKVVFKHSDFTLRVDTITANWAPDALEHIRKGIHIKQLKADTVSFEYNDVDDGWFTEMPSLKDLTQQLEKLLKFQLKIEDFQANKLSIHLGQEPIHIDAITFTRGGSHQAQLFKTLRIQAQQGALSFDQAQDSVRLKWNVKVAELNNFMSALKGDIFSEGTLVLHDLNKIDSDTLLELQLKSKHLSYQAHTLDNFTVLLKGNLEKHILNLNTKLNEQLIESTFTGRLNRTANASDWQGEVKKFIYHTKQYGRLPSSTGKIHVQIDKLKHKIDSFININALGNNIVNAQFTLDDEFKELAGQLRTQLVDLEFLTHCFPQLEDIHGQANLTLNIKGPVLSPTIWGSLNLKDCAIDSAELSNLSTKLHLSELNLDSIGDGKLNINGKGTLGKGIFTVEGTSDFSQHSPIVDLSLKGKNLTLSQTPEYLIIADPNLRLQLKDKKPYLSGSIFIPEAEIETQAFGSDMVEPSHDMVIINSKQPIQTEIRGKQPADYAAALITNINIELGNKIRYKGFGLESGVSGKLNIFTQNANLHARGKLNLINGRYRVHGNILDIQQGHISFLGDHITNPTWDIKAAKQIYTPIQNKFFRMPKKQQDTVFFEAEDNRMVPHKPILVGISLKGSVQNPILKMFSVPTLKEADIMSYLVLNKPQRDASEAQTTLVLEAANELIQFLGNKRHDVKLDLAKNLKLDRFGLNQVSNGAPGQNDLEKTALIIGKHLSNKLYAEYSLRVLDRASTVSLRYLVGKHIVLQGSASKESASGDILFTFESG